jgi:hypothetical protein
LLISGRALKGLSLDLLFSSLPFRRTDRGVLLPPWDTGAGVTGAERQRLRLLVSEMKRQRVMAARRGVVCLTCDAELIDPKPHQLYCSRSCANRSSSYTKRDRRKRLCHKGHLVSGANAVRVSKGYQECRQCRLEHKARYRQKLRDLRRPFASAQPRIDSLPAPRWAAGGAGKSSTKERQAA